MKTIKTAPWEIKDRKIKIAIVGCGRIAQNHIDAIKAHSKDFSLIGLCDASQDALAPVCKATGAEGFSSVSDCLEKSQPDIVTLCTPSGLHGRQAIEIASQGKHVITEKPMATKWLDGLAMVQGCKYSNVRLFVVKQNRLNKPIQALKKAIEENRFGKIYNVFANVFWTRPQSYYDQAKWRGTWQMDGGAFMNQASHYIDLVQWLAGPIETVFSMTGTLARNIEAEDTGVIAIKWRSGAIGSVNVTMLTYPKNYEGSITIFGEKGTVKIGGIALNKIEKWEFADTKAEDEQIKSSNYETKSVYGFGHHEYYQNVVDVLRGRASPLVSGEDGLKSLELLIAAYRSARDKVAVNLPLEL